MKIKTLSTLTLLIAFLAGCHSMKVNTDTNKSYPFQQIKTYQWIPAPTEILDDEDIYINTDIQKSLNTQLVQRGLKQTLDPAISDIQITYYIKLKDEIEYTTPSNPTHPENPDFAGGFTYSRNDKKWSYKERDPDITVYAIEKGTLTVIAFNTKTGERIWRGNLKTKIDRSQSEEKQLERIQEASKKLISRFPR